jgi:predicted nucleotidyltransferase
MNLPDEWRHEIERWAARTASIREVWLFGSRATGHGRAESDVDLAVVLAPPRGEEDWALGAYFALGDGWQKELSRLIGRHVSLEAIRAGTDAYQTVRETGILLWVR